MCVQRACVRLRVLSRVLFRASEFMQSVCARWCDRQHRCGTGWPLHMWVPLLQVSAHARVQNINSVCDVAPCCSRRRRRCRHEACQRACVCVHGCMRVCMRARMLHLVVHVHGVAIIATAGKGDHHCNVILYRSRHPRPKRAITIDHSTNGRSSHGHRGPVPIGHACFCEGLVQRCHNEGAHAICARERHVVRLTMMCRETSGIVIP